MAYIKYDKRERSYTVSLGYHETENVAFGKLPIQAVHVHGVRAVLSDSVGGYVVIEVAFNDPAYQPEQWRLTIEGKVLHVRPPRGLIGVAALLHKPLQIVTSYLYVNHLTIRDELPLD